MTVASARQLKVTAFARTRSKLPKSGTALARRLPITLLSMGERQLGMPNIATDINELLTI